MRSWLLAALLALLALSLSEFATNIVAPALQRPSWPAPASWVAARLAWEGHPELIYGEREVFYQESARLGAGRDYFEANLPTTILPYFLIAPLRIDEARNVWVIFSLITFSIAWVALLRSLRISLPWVIALSALVLQYHPLRDDIDRGQAYAPMLLLSVTGALLMQRGIGETPSLASKGRNSSLAMAGMAYGLAAILKFYYGAVLLLWALVRRQATVLITALGVFGAAVVVTLISWGTGPWMASIPFSLTFRERDVTAIDFNQSFNGLLSHLLRYDAALNPTPVADVPGLIGPLWWGLVLLTLAVTLYSLWRAANAKWAASTPLTTLAQRLLPPALATPVALLLAPLCDEYHFVLALFPLLVVGVVLWDRLKLLRPAADKSRPYLKQYLAGWITFGISALLLAAPWPYRAPSMPGWQALLHYPRLYGNILLFGLIIVLILWPPKIETSS